MSTRMWFKIDRGKKKVIFSTSLGAESAEIYLNMLSLEGIIRLAAVARDVFNGRADKFNDKSEIGMMHIDREKTAVLTSVPGYEVSNTETKYFVSILLQALVEYELKCDYSLWNSVLEACGYQSIYVFKYLRKEAEERLHSSGPVTTLKKEEIISQENSTTDKESEKPIAACPGRWLLEADGTLHLFRFKQNQCLLDDSPFYLYKSKIKRIVCRVDIGEGVFSGYQELTALHMDNFQGRISGGAFCHCHKLTELYNFDYVRVSKTAFLDTPYMAAYHGVEFVPEGEVYPKYIGSYEFGAKFLEHMGKAREYTFIPSWDKIAIKSEKTNCDNVRGCDTPEPMDQFFENIGAVWAEALRRGEPSMWWFAGEILNWEYLFPWGYFDEELSIIISIMKGIMGDAWKDEYADLWDITDFLDIIIKNGMLAVCGGNDELNDIFIKTNDHDQEVIARTCYKIAAELGSVHAMLWLAWCCRDGKFGYEQNAELSAQWLTKAGKEGIPKDLKFHEFDFMTDIIDDLTKDDHQTYLWGSFFSYWPELTYNHRLRELDFDILLFFLSSLGLEEFAKHSWFDDADLTWDEHTADALKLLKSSKSEWYAWIDSVR